MNEDITNYPLSWPLRQERTKPQDRKRASFFATSKSEMFSYPRRRKHTMFEGARALETELRRLGVHEMIISSNLRVRSDGLPYSNQRKPDDPGIAVYFNWHKRDLVFACDRWTEVEDNLWAIVKHIEALRGQERWGVGSLDQAFAGYAALPDPDQRNWWEVLHVAQTAGNEEIRQAYIKLAKQYHPDAGGDAVMFDQIQKAYDLAMGKGGAK
jgi:hypothetical protein